MSAVIGQEQHPHRLTGGLKRAGQNADMGFDAAGSAAIHQLPDLCPTVLHLTQLLRDPRRMSACLAKGSPATSQYLCEAANHARQWRPATLETMPMSADVRRVPFPVEPVLAHLDRDFDQATARL